ncbi:hypothetical protein [Acetobacter nitrogenifigens]|uniref:hypothetical protein n=1 Tax=Acetobacter nitrogenifigens TaxID=285268 RepID=UPI0011BFCCB3|nr:hypothetical protein [Acetobacter nitrogenifigens]
MKYVLTLGKIVWNRRLPVVEDVSCAASLRASARLRDVAGVWGLGSINGSVPAHALRVSPRPAGSGM